MSICDLNKMQLDSQISDDNWLQFSRYMEDCQDEKCAHCSSAGKFPDT